MCEKVFGDDLTNINKHVNRTKHARKKNNIVVMMKGYSGRNGKIEFSAKRGL